MAGNLKIISGKYKGLTFDGDSIIGTRPTMNRVKESLFAMIQTRLKDSICLDLFAGSGNLGLEALSNGDSTCYFVDYNKVAIKTISDNINKLRINEKYFIYQNDYKQALKSFFEQKIKFDIIFLDPPYNSGFTNVCLEKIVEYDLLNNAGLVICEYESEEVANKNLKVWKERTYGSKKIVIYQK